MKNIVEYYNKFTEDKRLKSKHGRVEMMVTLHHIQNCLSKMDKNIKILDVGAGTGAYSIFLAEKGYDVTAVELVKYNLGILKSKTDKVKAYQGDARNLKRFKSDSFDMVLLFGPMYHLQTKEDKLSALLEAKRVVKAGGLILISYLMNDYAVITHGFKDGKIINAIKNGFLNDDYKIIDTEDKLYSYSRVEDIKTLAKEAGLERIKMIMQDGPADFMRQDLNKMSEEVFDVFINYVIAVSEREELVGASSHVLDILIKK